MEPNPGSTVTPKACRTRWMCRGLHVARRSAGRIVQKNARSPVSVCMEEWMTYAQLDELSANGEPGCRPRGWSRVRAWR